MRTLYGSLITLVLLLTASNAYGVDEIATAFYFNDSVAGQKITIHGTFNDPGNRKVLLKEISTGMSREVDAIVLPTSDSLSFDLPTDLNSGRYKVTIKLIGASGALSELPVPGELRIPAPPALTVTIAAVRPVSPYPNPSPLEAPSPTPNPNPTSTPLPSPTPTLDQYDFEIAGTNFSPILGNNHIEIDDVPVDIRPCTDKGPVTCLGTELGNETRKLIVYRYSPLTALRPFAVGVRVGSNVAKAPTLLVFSSVSKRTLQFYAVGSFALLVGIVFLLVGTGLKLGKINREKYGSLKAFLLDRETNSYSLSKFQLTLFTLVTVFGYIYVFVCTLWVQGKFELPPVPENLPGMMAISVGTSVVAAGIGAKIGGKGAGPTSPSLADFITSGGVVLPERFQFFLWTIVSAGGVLALILASDPVTITQLPKLPEGLLYLMGLSSAGYLGGKLVRGPGPSVKSLDAQLLPGNVVKFTLNGDNLSPKATFQLDSEHIPADQVQIGEKTLQGQALDLCSMLEVKLSNVAQRYLDGPHLFRIINPDSQGADFKYGATIEAVTPANAGDENFSLQFANFVVKGTNFKDPSAAQWIDAAGTVTKLGPESVTKKSDTELLVSLPPGTNPAKISIVSPGGLPTTFDLTSGAHSVTPTAAAPTIQSSEIGKVDVPEKPSVDGKPAEPVYTALEVTLNGDNLSSEAGFQLDGEPVLADQVIVIDKTPGSQDPKLCTMLKVRLKNVDPRFYDGHRVLRITNPFSPGVDIQYGATIEPVGPIAAGNAPIPVSVKGTNFEEPSSAEWTDAAGTTTAIPAANITKKSDTELEVTLTPGATAGQGKLTIKSPGGLTTTVEVTVAGP